MTLSIIHEFIGGVRPLQEVEPWYLAIPQAGHRLHFGDRVYTVSRVIWDLSGLGLGRHVPVHVTVYVE